MISFLFSSLPVIPVDFGPPSTVWWRGPTETRPLPDWLCCTPSRALSSTFLDAKNVLSISCTWPKTWRRLLLSWAARVRLCGCGRRTIPPIPALAGKKGGEVSRSICATSTLLAAASMSFYRFFLLHAATLKTGRRIRFIPKSSFRRRDSVATASSRTTPGTSARSPPFCRCGAGI